MPMARSLLPLLFISAAVVSFPQDKKLARLEGRVVNSVTGQPVRKAKLRISQRAQEPQAAGTESDAAGHFAFENLEPGTYQLMAEKPGYLQQVYGSRAGAFTGILITLSARQEMKDLDFKLMPQGVITGKVLDEDGEPAGQGVYVNVMRGTGNRRPMAMAGEMTNDLGEFRVPNLSPGRYIVVANPQNRGGLTVENGPKTEPAETPITTYYPGVTDPGAATILDLMPGQELSGIVIPLRKVRAYRVQGKIAGPTASHSPNNTQIILSVRDRKDWGMSSVAGSQVKKDGSFLVENVPPGAYWANVLVRSDHNMAAAGRAPVDVADGNVAGVVIPLTQPFAVTGKVRMEDGGQPLSLDALRLTLRGEEGMSFGFRPASVSTDGSFKVPGVSPGKYSVYLLGLQETTYLKSVRLGNQETIGKGLDLTEAQGTVNLELVLGAKPGTVEGAVAEEGKAQPGVGVTLVPDPPRESLRGRVKFASADQNGHFSMKGVAPGNYTLYALPDSSEYELLFDPDAMKAYEGKGVKVTVEEGRATQASVTPIKPEEAPGRTP
ncbi:MAG TPA: carboxypeptidase regulatory-like domain-containing protein [Bryobacteraceae bacterium]